MNQPTSHAGIGVSSILLIIVILSLTMFASLAYLSAKQDQRFTEATAENMHAYYAADAQAQEKLAVIDAAIGADTLSGVPGLTQTEDGVSFTVPITEGQELYVRLSVGNGAYSIEDYKTRSLADEAAEEAAPQLWSPGS